MKTCTNHIAVLLTLLLPACTVNYAFDVGDGSANSAYFEEKTKRVNPLLVIGPQPEKIDLAALQVNDIQKVISFRTPKEIEDLGFKQEADLRKLGIEFANIPIGGDDFPYSPAAYHSLVDELSGLNVNDGSVLLHCKSGWRASVIGVAYLVKHEGMALNDAVKYAEGWWPLSLEKVLDTELLLQERSE